VPGIGLKRRHDCRSKVRACPSCLPPSGTEILLKAIYLMHLFVQDRHDTNIAVAEPPPINEVLLISEKIAVDTELCRDWPRYHAMGLDFPEGFEQSSEIAISLLTASLVSGVAVNGVEAVRRCFLDPDGGHSGSGPVAGDDVLGCQRLV
jgi:hypothetical protein